MKSTQSYRTKLKALILDTFKAQHDGLLSASDIYQTLVAGGARLNLTTVYRNLDAMTQEGLILRFSEQDSGKALYKYSGDNGGCREHLHLKCTECGDMIHLDCHFMQELSEHAQKDHGFCISPERSMLYGVCSVCQSKHASSGTEV